MLDGGPGADLVLYEGLRGQYSVVVALADGSFEVTDLRTGRPDGKDLVRATEAFQFLDRTYSITDVVLGQPISLAEPHLPKAWVKENGKTGTVIGTLSATEPYPGDTLRFNLIGDAGGRFRIDGNRLLVADALKLDYEQASSHRITVQVTDARGLTLAKSFTVAIGDEISEIIQGTSGGNILRGGPERDVLSGGKGKDVLTGGKGKDAFVFDTKPAKSNVDRITDFNPKDDSIRLGKDVFKKFTKKSSLEKPAKLSKCFFEFADKADDRTDYILYNKKTGRLYYDADGSGSKDPVQFAQLKKGLKMTYKDFYVI